MQGACHMEHMPPFFLHLKDWTLFMETAHRISNPPRAITADVQRDSLHIHPGVACCGTGIANPGTLSRRGTA